MATQSKPHTADAATTSAEIAADTELAALKDRKEVYDSGEGYSIGPFGRPIPNKRFASQTYAFRDPKKFLYDPITMIANPEPGAHYAWPLMEDPQTQARLRGGLYSYVEVKDCDKHTMAEVTTQKGTNGERVLWYKHVLVKIGAEAYSRLYDEPAAFSQSRLSSQVESFKNKVTEVSKGVAKPSVEMGIDSGTQ